MRPWRKLHSLLLTSDKLATVSDSAALLYMFLLIAQDDRGLYPITPTMRKRLSMTREWSTSQFDSFIQELRTAELIRCFDNEFFAVVEYVEVIKGAEMNGQPKQYRTAFTYPNIPALPEQCASSAGAVLDEKRREEKRLETGTVKTAPVDASTDEAKDLNYWLHEMGRTEGKQKQVGVLVDLAKNRLDSLGLPSAAGSKAAALLNKSPNAFEAVEKLWNATETPETTGDVFVYALALAKSQGANQVKKGNFTSKNAEGGSYGRFGNHTAPNSGAVFRRKPTSG